MSSTATRRRGARAEETEPGTEPAPDQEEEESEEEQAGEPAEEPGSVEAQRRKIDNAQRRYRRDLERIVGDLGDAHDCPLCQGLGFVDTSEALSVREDLERCGRCRGLGFMLTGSLVPEHAQLPCPECTGQGYVRIADKQAPATTAAPVVQLPLPAQQVHGWWDPQSQTFHPYGEQAAT